MKNVWLAILVVAVLCAVLFLHLRTDNIETIRIGHVSPLSGDAATYGEPMKKAAELAVEEINNSGGINGKRLEIIYEDSKCKGKDALSAVQKLVSVDGVRIISGFACAEDVLTAASFIEANKILTLAPGASGPNVSLAGEYIFQTNPSTTVLLRKLAEFIYRDYAEVAIVSEETSFAQDNKNYFTKVFESLGGQVVFSESYTSDTKDFRSILTKLHAVRPDAIFINPQTEIAGGLLIKQLREMGSAAKLYGVDILSGPEVRTISGKAAENLTLVTVPDLDSLNRRANEFLARYREKYGEISFPLYLAAAYDSIYLIAKAIEEVGTDTQKLKEYLYALSDYEGAIGTFRFDQNGDLVGLSFAVRQIKSGELVIISN